MNRLQRILNSTTTLEVQFQQESCCRGITDPEVLALAKQYLTYRTLFEAAILEIARMEQDQFSQNHVEDPA